MELRQRLQMKLAQKLVMTPNLQMAIRLLQLNRLELQQAVTQELLENPVLEVVEEQSAETEQTTEEKPEQDPLTEVEWESLLAEDSTREYGTREHREAISYENILTRPATLEEHLIWQLNLVDLSPVDHRIGLAIIGSINSDGYLTSGVEELATRESTTPHQVEEVLGEIQKLDPTGIGARNPRECLLLQLKETELEGTLSEAIIRDHLGLLERHAFPQMAKALGAGVAEVQKAAEAIRRLEPKPGRAYSSHRAAYIEPDVYIAKVDGEYVVLLNSDGLPRLRISRAYRRILLAGKDGNSDGTRQYLEQKLSSARWLMKSIEQRQRTVYKVAESILRFQREFFDKGIAYLRPLVLRDVADDIGMHESTVSRVSSNKFMHTPQGTYVFKFFFHSGLESRGGEDVSSVRVKEMIRTIVEGEDSKRPYSDKKIGDLLAEQGIQIARRTVAKYREELKILPSSRRRAYV